MALPYALSTVPHLRAYLRSDEADLVLLDQMIDAATLAIEDACRDVFVQHSLTEHHSGGAQRSQRGGAKRIYLNASHIQSVTSILDDQPTPYAIQPTDYTILDGIGALQHLYHWPPPLWQWHITYSGGWFADTDSVDEALRLACNREAAYLLREPRGPIASESTSRRTASFTFDTKSQRDRILDQMPAKYVRVGI